MFGFAASTALLWVALIPLWDGFDEAQHYSYVQALRIDRTLPVFGQTRMTPEVWESLLRSPVSPAVKINYPVLRTFSEVRANLPWEEPPHGEPVNYEAHQAPLVYLGLAPLESALGKMGVSIGWRLRVLRFCLLIGAMGVFWNVVALSPHRNAAFFMIVTTEMFLASCGHVANDGIAVPIFVWLFFESERRSRAAAVLLGAGLLVKAYFLAFVPLVVWRLRRQWRWLFAAGILPAFWYGRNLLLYGNLSGMQEQLAGIPTGELLRAGLQLPWTRSLGETFRGALWLGNNSFLQWSVWQVNVFMTAVLAVACVAVRRNGARRKWLLMYAGCYAAALAFAAVQTFIFTNGDGVAASPWYATPLWLLLILAAFSGDARSWGLSALVAIWCYWFVATFWFRLIPWYAGVMDGPANLSNLARWYGSSFGQIRHEIGDGVLMLALWTSLLAIATAGAVGRGLWKGQRKIEVGMNWRLTPLGADECGSAVRDNKMDGSVHGQE